MRAPKLKFEPTGDGGPALAKATQFILDLAPEAVPQEVMDRAALQFLDTLGVAIAALQMEPGFIARETAALLHGTDQAKYAARMMFDGRRVSLAGAAFAGATAIDNLDAHDGYNPTKGHIGVVVLPTLVALAEGLPQLSGPEALATWVVGYEVSGRAATALHATVPEYHTSGAWNALGVAAMVARLRKLSPSQLREALGIAEFHGPRSQMMREIATPTMLHDGSSFGAMAGVTSAIQAELGFTGAPAVTVEDPEVLDHWTDLGQVWQVLLQYIKPYPTCRWVHAAIEGMRVIFEAQDIACDEIAKIDVRTFFNAAELFHGAPNSSSQAQYSMDFPLAAMAVYRTIGVEHIAGAGLKDPAVLEMMQRIEVREAPFYTENYPANRWADVTITLTDGRRFESGTVSAQGGPDSPWTAQQIIAKFDQFAVPVLGQERAEKIKNAVLSLTEKDSQFSDLSQLLYAPPAA